MSRFGRALRSLRWRLTLTYLVLIAVLLVGLGAFQYVMLRGSLIDGRVADAAAATWWRPRSSMPAAT